MTHIVHLTEERIDSESDLYMIRATHIPTGIWGLEKEQLRRPNGWNAFNNFEDVRWSAIRKMAAKLFPKQEGDPLDDIRAFTFCLMLDCHLIKDDTSTGFYEMEITKGIAEARQWDRDHR